MMRELSEFDNFNLGDNLITGNGFQYLCCEKWSSKIKNCGFNSSIRKNRIRLLIKINL